MNYLNLDVKTLRSHELLGSEPVDRATWLALMTYCAIQENGGSISDCKEWGDRKWMQLVGVTKAEVSRKCELWKIRAGTLEIWGYPQEKEKEILEKRKAGKITAEKRWGTHSENLSLADSSATSSADAEGKGRERKGKEVEAKASCSEPDEPASEPEPIMVFSTVGKSKEWALASGPVAEWQQAYPDMDVFEACNAARLWCLSNPSNRKTPGGMPRFLNGWLSRAQDRGQYRRGASEQKHYFTPTHPDAFLPFGDLLRKDFNASLGPRAAEGDQQAIEFLQLINGETEPCQTAPTPEQN